MDDGIEAVVGFVGSQGDALELSEFAEEVLDQMTLFVDLGIDWQGLGAALMLRDDDLCPALVEFGDDGIAVEGLVGDQCAEIDAVDRRWPGSSTKRTRLPSASVSARILVVMPPFEPPMAWLCVPLLRLGRGGEP